MYEGSSGMTLPKSCEICSQYNAAKNSQNPINNLAFHSMKTVFEEIITRYGVKRGEFVSATWPKTSKWREALKLSDSPRAEEYFDEEIDFYRQFESELDDIPRLKGKEISTSQWEEVVHFLKIHNERLSSQIDNSTTLTATFVFFVTILLLLAKLVYALFYIPFIIVAYFSIQIFFQRIDRRHELARNRELALIIENYLKKRRTS
jgi:hypothetical protein